MNILSDNPVSLEIEYDYKQEINKLQSLINISSEWTWQTDQNHKFCMLSRGALHTTSIITSDLIGKKIWDADKFMTAFNISWEQLKEKMESIGVINEFIINYINSKGQINCFSISGIPFFTKTGDFGGYIGVASNLTNYQQDHSGVLRILNTDPLTGYPNLKTTEEFFNKSLVTATRKNKNIGLIYINVHQLTKIHYQYNFQEIIRVLITICKRLNSIIRKYDCVCRLGLNDFCVVVHEISQAVDLEKIVKKINKLLTQPYEISDHQLTLNFDIVNYLAPDKGKNLSGLIEKARNKLNQ